MKNFTFCLLAAIVFVAASCSKEKKLENRLSGNTWNIDKIEWTKTETGLSGFLFQEGTETNAGTITFTETTGSSTMTIDDETEDNAGFSWDVAADGENLNMTYDLTIEGTTTTQRVMAIEENKKKSQTWVLIEQRVDASTAETYQLAATLELSR